MRSHVRRARSSQSVSSTTLGTLLLRRHPMLTDFAITVSLLALASARLRSAPTTGYSTQQMGTMQQSFFPYWSLETGFASTVTFSNATGGPIIAEPTLYNLNGDPLPVPPVTVPATSRLALSIATWVQEAGQSTTFTQGSLSISYQASDARNLASQVTITNSLRHLSFDIRDEMPMMYMSSRLDGIWWQATADADYKLVVTNTTDALLSVDIAFSPTPDASMAANDSITLEPHQAKLIDLQPVSSGQSNTQGIASMGGVTITYTGAPGSVTASGMLTRTAATFSSVFPFSDPAARESSVLAAAHFMVGQSDLPGFSPQTSFSTLALLRNTSASPITVSPWSATRQTGA
jgi:hypothetical protein